MLVSKFGFMDVLEPNKIVLDPSRIAAQIVTGIGFLGAGLIFVKGGSVKGLTTAASVWCTAAVGAVAGSGLLAIAAAGTVGYFAVVVGLQVVRRLVPGASASTAKVELALSDRPDLLNSLLAACDAHGFG